jgi:hypothetical protein
MEISTWGEGLLSSWFSVGAECWASTSVVDCRHGRTIVSVALTDVETIGSGDVLAEVDLISKEDSKQ